MRWQVWIAVIIIFIFSSYSGYSLGADVGRPPLNNGRIAAEYLAAGVGGMVIGTAGVIGAYMTNENMTPVAAISIVSISSILGSSIGAYIVGSLGNETGSFLATLGGSIVGGFLGFVIDAGLYSLVVGRNQNEMAKSYNDDSNCFHVHPS